MFWTSNLWDLLKWRKKFIEKTSLSFSMVEDKQGNSPTLASKDLNWWWKYWTWLHEEKKTSDRSYLYPTGPWRRTRYSTTWSCKCEITTKKKSKLSVWKRLLLRAKNLAIQYDTTRYRNQEKVKQKHVQNKGMAARMETIICQHMAQLVIQENGNQWNHCSNIECQQGYACVIANCNQLYLDRELSNRQAVFRIVSGSRD